MIGKIDVTIVATQTHKRDSVATMLSLSGDIDVIGSFDSGEELLENLETRRPQVVLIDALLAGMTGPEASVRVKKRNKSAKVLLLSVELEKKYLERGIECGIDGYLRDDAQYEILFDAIRAVHRGEKYFPEEVKLMVFEDFYSYNMENGFQARHQDELSGLTAREMEVFQLAAAAKSNKEIAGDLQISVKTVETHKLNIYNKLGLRNKVELVRYAIENDYGLIDQRINRNLGDGT